ncbi:ABC transporter permease [Aerosakkonema funiforme]|uniref:ABC transporter permease n=1 Tax=Aerosakkonema funiforme TaxID=1246630 RepID=UPI0035BB9AE9
MQIILANIMAIYRKELQSYFASPLAYAIAGVFWFVAGCIFMTILLGTVNQAAEYDRMYGATVPPIDVANLVLQSFLNVMGSFSLFVLPMLSMGLYADERKRGTLELLATSPITNWAVSVGKLLGVLTFFTAIVMPMLAYEAIALSAADPPVPPAVPLLGHLGLILLAASVLSLGMFISSLTDSNVLAAIFTFVAVLLLWMIDLFAGMWGGWVGAVFSYLSLLKHYNNLVQGILDSSSLIFFATFIVLGVFLTAQSIDALRFQRSS